jgi:hypothetical protein
METKIEITEEVAVSEVKAFAEYHLEKSLDEDKVREDYPDAIEAVKQGLLTFDDNQSPSLKLKKPIKTESGDVALADIKFRTRIVTSEQESIAKGIDIKNDMLRFVNKLKSAYISQPKAMLDKFGKFDLRVIEQVVSVF